MSIPFLSSKRRLVTLPREDQRTSGWSKSSQSSLNSRLLKTDISMKSTNLITRLKHDDNIGGSTLAQRSNLWMKHWTVVALGDTALTWTLRPNFRPKINGSICRPSEWHSAVRFVFLKKLPKTLKIYFPFVMSDRSWLKSLRGIIQHKAVSDK